MKEVQTENFSYQFLRNKEMRTVVKYRALDMVARAHGKAMVIFLDKSARPLSVLLRNLYPVAFPNDPLPAIRFANIGTEKFWLIDEALRQRAHRQHRISIDSVGKQLAPIRGRQVLADFYGKENADYLRSLLRLGRKIDYRLVVDDTICSGDTRDIAMWTLQRTDPKNYYDFFPFLESQNDKYPFSDSFGVPYLPWHNDYTLVAEPRVDLKDVNNSFAVSPMLDEDNKTKSRQVRLELKHLCQEIISDLS